ncbi:hypothetical protein, variant [Exophiala oligosperma]|nr:hypothetical protein, variant [Exophiala oligosperma]KIW46206.1 hypothetical protein, variant [Exophiala oligosperma]
MRDHPIRLNSAISGHLGASYPLVNPMTEAYICPNSLLFTPQGDRFIAGSDSLLSLCDLSRPGQEPISSIQTGPKRKTSDYNATTNMRGLVSTLAVDSSSGLLAAGTFGRQIGLYASMGQGECVGVFSVKDTAADDQIGGSGITQVAWSRDGRYLYISERKSDGVIIYDIRNTGQLLSWLVGRNAQTNQRLSINLTSTDEEGGHEIWGGGVDGEVRVWKDCHHQEGPIQPAFSFKAHNDAISGTAVHSRGGVLATASGQRRFGAGLDEGELAGGVIDSTIKIWSL